MRFIYIQFIRSFLGVLAPVEKKDEEIKREIQFSELVTDRVSLQRHFLRERDISYGNRELAYRGCRGDNYKIDLNPRSN